MYFFKIRRIRTEPTWLSVWLTLAVRGRRLVWMVSGVFLWSCWCIVASWPFKHIFISSPRYTLPSPSPTRIANRGQHWQQASAFSAPNMPLISLNYRPIVAQSVETHGPWHHFDILHCEPAGSFGLTPRLHFVYKLYTLWVTQCTTKHRATFLSVLGFRQRFILEIQRQVCMWYTARPTEFDWQQRFL